ncbi:hypothetical protein CRG98_009506 [Punica granatum]|uniref:Uncharacterized protein n=1 Tax=Punica granatum TaxID=22663 RepID=A0A2I0KP34_PUNGR|nr:hypothetical protein CRG98_009506 [Punica granatum]
MKNTGYPEPITPSCWDHVRKLTDPLRLLKLGLLWVGRWPDPGTILTRFCWPDPTTFLTRYTHLLSSSSSAHRCSSKDHLTTLTCSGALPFDFSSTIYLGGYSSAAYVPCLSRKTMGPSVQPPLLTLRRSSGFKEYP